jgi:CO/xanthine dehydrogenase FAD-binding subunit
MGNAVAYWRPATLEGALALLRRPGAVLIGGGTKVNAAPAFGPVEIVDLQALGLDRIEPLPGAVSAGACATLQQILENAAVPPVVREAARREEPSTLRHAATIGGCVAAGHWESELLAALLACDAVVTLAGPEGEQIQSLAALLSDGGKLPGRIITRISMVTGGVARSARTGRTTADRPIVAAGARRAPEGVRLALSGVAARPVLRGPETDMSSWLDSLDPPGDFRGSAEYRRALAVTLARRVLEAIG